MTRGTSRRSRRSRRRAAIRRGARHGRAARRPASAAARRRRAGRRASPGRRGAGPPAPRSARARRRAARRCRGRARPGTPPGRTAPRGGRSRDRSRSRGAPPRLRPPCGSCSPASSSPAGARPVRRRGRPRRACLIPARGRSRRRARNGVRRSRTSSIGARGPRPRTARRPAATRSPAWRRRSAGPDRARVPPSPGVLPTARSQHLRCCSIGAQRAARGASARARSIFATTEYCGSTMLPTRTRPACVSSW